MQNRESFKKSVVRTKFIHIVDDQSFMSVNHTYEGELEKQEVDMK